MSLTNADLLAISDLLDKKIDPLERRIGNLENRFDGLENEVKGIKFQLENNIVPRLTNIEKCYISTYDRYINTTEKIERYMEKQDVLTALVLEHEQKLKKLGM